MVAKVPEGERILSSTALVSRPRSGAFRGERREPGQRTDFQFSRDHGGSDLRMAAQLKNRHISVRPESDRRQRVARKGVGLGTKLRHADGRAFHVFETADFRVPADNQFLAGKISRCTEYRHIRTADARASERRDTGEHDFNIAGDQRLDQAWAASDQQNLGDQIVFRQNSQLLGYPRQRQGDARTHVRHAQLIGGTNRSARGEKNCRDQQSADKSPMHNFHAAIG